MLLTTASANARTAADARALSAACRVCEAEDGVEDVQMGITQKTFLHAACGSPAGFNVELGTSKYFFLHFFADPQTLTGISTAWPVPHASL